MDKLSIDFKGPLPSATQNHYLLTVVDEYSRFPFAFPCPNMHAQTVIRCLEVIFGLCGMPSYIHSDRGSSFMSQELKTYLSQKGIATSKTTPYHPIGNGQCERYNGIIWKSIRLHLKSHNLHENQWELALVEALHSIRSLLCTSTNTTPHERFFGFQRRSTHGNSLPAWLMSPGPVLLRRFVRTNKNEPLVDEVDLLEANPTFANIRYSNGRESTVSVRDLAPCPKTLRSTKENEIVPDYTNEVHPQNETSNNAETGISPSSENPTVEIQYEVQPSVLRKSSRNIKAPVRYGWD